MFNVNGQTYLTTAEAADTIGYALQTFHNRRSREGDGFIPAHEFVPGHLFYRKSDVQRVAMERDQ